MCCANNIADTVCNFSVLSVTWGWLYMDTVEALLIMAKVFKTTTDLLRSFGVFKIMIGQPGRALFKLVTQGE